MCIIMEAGSTTIIADYDRLAAAGDLALQYIEGEILPAEVKIRKIVRSAGSSCGSTYVAAKEALKLFEEGIDCDVFVGPGSYLNSHWN